MTDYLDFHEELTIKTGGNLPHWHQDCRIQFITFRLADSLPQCKINELKDKITSFRTQNPEPWNYKTKHKYRTMISETEEQLLENGYGSCILAEPKIREIVTSAIDFNAGKTYDLMAYVVMPNHVHMLVRLYPENKVSDIVHSIKRFSSKQINGLTGNAGSLWMREYYDRIARNEDEVKHYISYIKNNPNNLQTNQYSLYIAP